MSDTAISPPQPLHRSRVDRKLLGVCGGFAQHYGMDPTVVRIAVGVLALFGGLGIVVYLLGAVWLPEPGDDSDILSRGRLPLAIVAGLAAVIILPNFVFPFGDGTGVLVVIGVVALIILLARRPVAAEVYQPSPDAYRPGPDAYRPGPDAYRPGPDAYAPSPDAYQPGPDAYRPGPDAYPPGPDAYQSSADADPSSPDANPPSPDAYQPSDDAYPPSAAATAPLVDDAPTYAAMPYPQVPVAAPPQPRQPRRRSYLGAIALCASIIWFGLAWALNASDLTSFTAVTIFGISLAILAAGILVGAWIGRARWLVLFALPLALVVWGLSAVPDSIRLGEAGDWAGDGIGQTWFTPTSTNSDDFAWGFGTAYLNVDELGPYATEGVHEVTASVGVGSLVIHVPENWDVVIDAGVGFGEITRDGEQLANGAALSERLTIDSPAEGAQQLHIQADVDLGDITVTTTNQGA